MGARQVNSPGSSLDDQVISSYRLATRAWFVAIAGTYTLSIEGVQPLSNSSCKKDRMVATLQEDESSFQTAHQLEKTDWSLWDKGTL